MYYKKFFYHNFFRNPEPASYGKRLLEHYGGRVKKLKSSLSLASSYHQQQAQSEDVEESPDKEHHRNLAKYVIIRLMPDHSGLSLFFNKINLIISFWLMFKQG